MVQEAPSGEASDCAPLAENVAMPIEPTFEPLMRLAMDVGKIVSLGAAHLNRVVAFAIGAREARRVLFSGYALR